MGNLIFFKLQLLFAGIVFAKAPYQCGKKEQIKRSYGQVELRVDCQYHSDNLLSRVEYKGKTQHGFQMDYDTLWRKKDSSFFINGKEQGLCLFWDTLGNVIGKETYHNGKYVGKRESYFAPGHPSLIKNYNPSGKEDGPWQEWWKNGNKKAEYVAKNGEIILGTQYYQDGKPRVKYQTKYDPKNLNVFKMKRIQAEAWAPNGKSTGKIEKGNGEWIVFPDGKDTANHSVFHEVYKDSLMIKAEKLDSTEIAKWLKP